MNASQFPGQTIGPIPLFNNGPGFSDVDTGDTLLQKIAQLLYNYSSVDTPGGTFIIPKYDDIKFTYYGATNNIQTEKFYAGGSLVAGGTLTFTYAGGGASSDDLVTDIKQT